MLEQTMLILVRKESGMKVLIVYYTMTGNTGRLAKEIKKIFNFHVWQAGIRRIKSKAGFLKTCINTLLSKPSDIGYGRCNLDEYDIVFLGTPVWAGKPNSAMITFVDNLPDCTGKKFVFFTTSILGRDKSVKILEKKILKKNGSILGSYSFKSKDLKVELQELVQSFLDNIKIFEIE